MKTDELRERYISFFIRHGHTHLQSASLVPQDDPTLLFTGAGMNQFKAQFLGKEITFTRAVTCQKCLRTDDLVKVGKTPSHHTFFEMLGNFSFGDYFKKEAIGFAWEFVTKELRLDPKRLWVSVYKEDEEAYSIWEKAIHFPREKIFCLDDKENFWPAEAPRKGPNGPCGPCSEIFYDQGERYGCGKSTCNVSCSCGRFVEIWNLVFTQFDRRPDGTLAPLPQKNIDTGMGLERTAAVLQGVPNNFEIDLLFPILKNAAEIAKVNYGSDPLQDVHLRIITDHIRAIVFAISDGVFPSNEGRGYVLRRLIRLGLRQGMNLGLKPPFLYRLIHIVNKQMAKGYPELEGRHNQISLMVKSEEEKFINTLSQGEDVLMDVIANAGENRKIRGSEAFKLYDTYGLPLEIIKEISGKKGVEVDEEGFEKEMERQKALAREGSVLEEDIFKGAGGKEIYVHFPRTEFTGYLKVSDKAKILGIIREGKSRESISQGEKCEIILDRTPFYAEAGGQIGDTGRLNSKDFSFAVENTSKVEDVYIHAGFVEKGKCSVNQEVDCEVDFIRRQRISVNHTATHILHFALREILGSHVTQAGSYVGADRLRFDFHHYKGLTSDEIDKIERLVNEKIREGSKVEICETTLSQAKKEGAIALFGEKYSDKVRLVRVGSFSKELCAGIHVSSIASLGLFIITSERAVSAGLRRIEAVTGENAFIEIKKGMTALNEIIDILKVNREEISGRVEEILKENKKLKKEMEKRESSNGELNLEGLIEQAISLKDIKLVKAEFRDYSMENLRDIADRLKKKMAAAIGGLASVKDDRVNLVIFVTPSLVTRFRANEIIKELGEVLGGGGGGRPDLAQAGGKDPAKIKEVFEELERKVREAI